MGYARIISGGPTGRYTVELDYGSSTRTLLLSATNTLVARLDAAIATQQLEVTNAEVLEAAQVAKVQAAEAQLIASVAGGLPPGQSSADTTIWRFEVARLTELRRNIEPLRQRLRKLELERAQALRRAAYWQAFNPIERRDVWCADLTENAPAGALVATADIPGESNILVLAPGCRRWSPSDGELTARELMSPAQAYLNAAILPGWQKFKPTYRWGTITAINYEADTCNVNLADTRSSAQRLGVNQTGSLSGVPVIYSVCNSKAFIVGDRVVVQFLAQNWGSPRVIGFLDNPRACQVFPLLAVGLRFEDFDVGASGTRPWITSTTFNTTCNVLALGSFNAAQPTLPSASHRIFVDYLGISGTPLPLESVINSTVPQGEVLWTGSSSAFGGAGPPGGVPAGDAGTSVFPDGGGFRIRRNTRNSSIQTLSTYNASCVPQTTFTGGLFISDVQDDLIPEQSVLTWLTSIGRLPEISVTSGAVTRQYQPQGAGFQFSRPPLGPWRWTLLYEPVPL